MVLYFKDHQINHPRDSDGTMQLEQVNTFKSTIVAEGRHFFKSYKDEHEFRKCLSEILGRWLQFHLALEQARSLAEQAERFHGKNEFSNERDCYDRIVSALSIDHRTFPLYEMSASALLKKGNQLLAIEHADDAIRAFNGIIAQCSPAVQRHPLLRRVVAESLFQKALALEMKFGTEPDAD